MERAIKYNDGYDYYVPEDDDFDIDEYLIDVNEEDIINTKDEITVLEQEVQRQRNELKLRSDLMYKQALLKIVKIGDRARDTGARIGKILSEIKEKAQTYEKDYIANKDVIEEFEEKIKNIKCNYKKGIDLKVEYKSDCEKREHEAMEKKSDAKNKMEKMKASKEYKKYAQDVKKVMDELSQAVFDGDSEKEQIKREELMELKRRNPTLPYSAEMKQADILIAKERERISEAEEEIHAWDQMKNKILDETEKDMNEAFSGLVKQNFWQRLVGSIVNKFTKANKVKNNVFGQIKKLTAKLKEEGKRMSEKYETWQEANAQAQAEKAQEKEQIKAEKAQVKAAREEEKRKHKDDIMKNLERRLAETEKQLEVAKAQRAQNSGKNMTPAFEGGNIVPFEGRD